MDTKVIGGSRRIYESENFIRTYSLSPDSLAENMKIYLLELLQIFIRKEGGRRVVDFSRFAGDHCISTEWGEIELRGHLFDGGDSELLSFYIPERFFARDDAAVSTSDIVTSLYTLGRSTINYHYWTEGSYIWGSCGFYQSSYHLEEGDRTFFLRFNGDIVRLALGAPEPRDCFYGDVAAGILDPFARRLYQALCSKGEGYSFIVSKKKFFDLFNLARPSDGTFETEYVPSIVASLKRDAGLEVEFSSGRMRPPKMRELECFCFKVIHDDNLI